MYYKKHTYLEITTGPDGKLHVDSNNFQYKGMTKQDLAPAIIPFLGMSDHIMIRVKTGPEDIYKNPMSSACKKYQKEDKEILDFISSRLRIQSYGYIFVKPDYAAFTNTYENYRYLARSKKPIYTITQLQKQLEGRDIVFCGAGPSIKEYLDDIRKIIKDNSAIVVAGGSAMRLFCQENIQPHICMAFDCWESEWDNVITHLKPEWAKDLPIIAGVALEHRSFKWWAEHGGDIYLNGGLDVLGLYHYIDNLPKFSNGLAVSNAIIELCNLSKVKSLTYFGVDLCLGKDDSLYADGQVLDTIMDQIKDYNGFKTRQAWINEVDILAMRAHQAKYPIRQVGKYCMPISNITQRTKVPKLKKGWVKSNLASVDYLEMFKRMKARSDELIPQILNYDFDDPERSKTKIYQLLYKPFEDVQFGNTLRGGRYDYLLLNSVKEYHANYLKSLSREIKGGLETHIRESNKDIPEKSS